MTDISSSVQAPPATALIGDGDLGAMTAALAVESGITERHTSNAARDAVEAIEENEENREVQAMRDKAGHIFDQALLEGIGMIASSAADCAGKGTAYQVGGAVTNAALRVGGAVEQGQLANDDADAAQHRSNAEIAANNVGRMQDDAKNAGDYVSSALEFYRQYVTTEASATSAALHRA